MGHSRKKKNFWRGPGKSGRIEPLASPGFAREYKMLRYGQIFYYNIHNGHMWYEIVLKKIGEKRILKYIKEREADWLDIC